MPEIIDILTTKIDESGQFVVNTGGVLSVDMTNTVGAQTDMFAGNGTFKFKRGDCFIVLSVAYFMPERFVLWNHESAGLFKDPFPKMLLMGHKITSGTDIPLYTVGNNGFIRIPFPNYEFSMGVFQNPEQSPPIDEDFSIRCMFPYMAGIDFPQVSMVNVPAVLNGVTVRVVPWIKVLHNFPLDV